MQWIVKHSTQPESDCIKVSNNQWDIIYLDFPSIQTMIDTEKYIQGIQPIGYWGLLSTCVFANTHVGSHQEAMMGGCLGFSKKSHCTVCSSMYVSTKSQIFSHSNSLVSTTPNLVVVGVVDTGFRQNKCLHSGLLQKKNTYAVMYILFCGRITQQIVLLYCQQSSRLKQTINPLDTAP